MLEIKYHFPVPTGTRILVSRNGCKIIFHFIEPLEVTVEITIEEAIAFRKHLTRALIFPTSLFTHFGISPFFCYVGHLYIICFRVNDVRNIYLTDENSACLHEWLLKLDD